MHKPVVTVVMCSSTRTCLWLPAVCHFHHMPTTSQQTEFGSRAFACNSQTVFTAPTASMLCTSKKAQVSCRLLSHQSLNASRGSMQFQARSTQRI